MRQRLLLLTLLGLNVILAGGWIITARRSTHRPVNGAVDDSAEVARAKTNFVVRRQFFSWQELESTDYPTYVTNLRNIGCPEETIRDIIVADVNQLYARRLAQRIPAAGTNRDQAEMTRRMRFELENERRALLTKLLGTNWETSATGAVAAVPAKPGDRLLLDGPVLGTLSPEAKQAVRDLINQAEADARKQGVGPKNPAEVVRLEKELWTKLAGVLSPQQLEEFKLRYSPNAAALRRKLDSLRFFNVTPDEFRGLFRVTDDIDNQLRTLGNANDVDTQEKRRNLEQQREAVIKSNLGDKRYVQYQQLQDPNYQTAVAQAQAADATGRAAQTLYQINEATSNEQALVQIDPTLSDAQKQIELKKIELEQAKAQAQALGEPVPPEPGPPPPPISSSVIPHPMGSAETLSSLSKLYGVTPAALQQANPGVNLNNLKPGDIVNIPYLAPPPQPPPQQ